MTGIVFGNRDPGRCKTTQFACFDNEGEVFCRMHSILRITYEGEESTSSLAAEELHFCIAVSISKDEAIC